MGKKLDLRGVRFGRLTVVEEAGRTKDGRVLWRCQCDCGGETVASSGNLRSGNTSSCGCLQSERAAVVHKVHGLANHPLYNVWKGMLLRCGLRKGASDNARRNYSDRGISVCDGWHAFHNFYNWATTHGYENGLELDRINNDCGYFPENCRFVTNKQNTNNRRCTARLPDGTPLAEFCSNIGIVTGEDGKVTRRYKCISEAYRTRNEVHPELFSALEKDLEKQERLLSQARSIRKEWEAIVSGLKEQLKSLQSISNQ